jgi:hypothetical protein
MIGKPGLMIRLFLYEKPPQNLEGKEGADKETF